MTDYRRIGTRKTRRVGQLTLEGMPPSCKHFLAMSAKGREVRLNRAPRLLQLGCGIVCNSDDRGQRRPFADRPTGGRSVTEDFRVVANRRLREARILQRAGEYSGSYYLAGYSVECALKACILKTMKKYHMPDKKIVADSHTHNLEQLVKLAGLEQVRAQYASVDLTFGSNWAVVKDWNESSRYETWSQQDAADLILAIGQRGSGVLAWTKKHW